jgi:hypothetical protein
MNNACRAFFPCHFAGLSVYLALCRLGGVWAHGFFKDRRVHQLEVRMGRA